MARDIRAELAAQGYAYLGGTAQRAENMATGERISRRQWEKVLGTPLGMNAQQRAARERLAGEYAARANIPVREARIERNFQRGERELRAVARAERRAAEAGRPWIIYGRPEKWEMRLRQALVDIGRRDPDWQMPVGESPGTGSRAA